MLNEKNLYMIIIQKMILVIFNLLVLGKKNYKSWINQKIFPIKLIKYEDLNVKTFEILKDIIEFIQNIIQEKKFNILKAQNAVKSS